MPLNKQPLSINFAQGLDTKTDKFQVSPGKFLKLQNAVFNKGGQLTKRNGYAPLTVLPTGTNANYLTTFSGNLTAIGSSLNAYSMGSNSWVNKGALQPIELDTLPILRNSTNQSQADSVVAPNGLICTVYTDNVPVSGTITPFYKYVVADSVTGQNILPPAVIPGSTNMFGSPRVYLLSNRFVIIYSTVNTINYALINANNPQAPSTFTTITSVYTPETTVAFDALLVNNSIYVAWNGSDGGGAIHMTLIDHAFNIHTPVLFTGESCTIMALSADTSGVTPIIYATYYDSGTMDGSALAVDQYLATVLGPTPIISGDDVANITCVADSGVCTFLYEINNAYTYDNAIPTNYVDKNTITVAGVLGSPSVLKRSVGLASKLFLSEGVYYFLAAYDSVFQPTYFLINLDGSIISKLAYSNGGGYLKTGLPNVTVNDAVAQVTYLFKDLIAGANKSQNAASAAGVYSQTGVNLAKFTIGTSNNASAEIGGDLNLSGGFLWMYDGYTPVEQGFHVWPDDVEGTLSGTGGHLAAQEYFYQVTYEWADNQGNVFRSAPSVPISVTTTGSTSMNTIHIPTLRLTYKISNPVKIVVYRWSTGQQIYYQVTSLTNPLLNDPTVDLVDFVDTQVDSDIIGNNILYTTGGVLENIGAPATSTLTLFQSRLWLVDAEDKNLLWFSKQVIQNTPVEMSDLLTIYVPPTTAAQGSTGPMLALSALDDKLIIFKKDAMYYINGQGPDNTGANSQYSDPVFITATVGCANQQSIVFMPNGLMFQSDKGIWLLGRDLSTSYIGAPVEDYTLNAVVESAVNVPGTNQVRFTLDSGVTLMYDYYYGQWGTFNNVPAISSTLYEGLHTYVNSFGQLFQETPGSYLDGSTPVLMSFTTSWLNLAGVQGYERFYFMYLLGEYASPFTLNVQMAFDYNPSPRQSVRVTPDNFTPYWGGGANWGSDAVWGGSGNLFEAKVYPEIQKCESFQITISENYDSSFGVPAGAGLTLSGLNIIVGMKKGYRASAAKRSFG